MANPTTVTIPAGTWALLATGVMLGTVKILNFDAAYHFTYRVTGDPAPVAGDEVNVQRCDEPRAKIEAEFTIDVYGFCPLPDDGLVEVSV